MTFQQRRCLALVVLVLVSVGCATEADSVRSTHGPGFAKAVVTREDVERSIQDERALSTNYERLPQQGEAWFAVLDGCGEVLVTAPHATNPTREGRLRFADTGTGSLATTLHRLTGARVIHISMASPSDPNYYDNNEFKSAVAAALLARKPVVVLDLHGSHPFRPYDVDFGTMGRNSLLGQDHLLAALSAALSREGLGNQSLDFFAAATSHTITRWVSSKGVPAIQLEINETWLNPGGSPLEAHRYAQLLQALARFIGSLGCSKPR